MSEYKRIWNFIKENEGSTVAEVVKDHDVVSLGIMAVLGYLTYERLGDRVVIFIAEEYRNREPILCD